MKKFFAHFCEGDEIEDLSAQILLDYNKKNDIIWHKTKTSRDGGDRFCYTRIYTTHMLVHNDTEGFHLQKWYGEKESKRDPLAMELVESQVINSMEKFFSLLKKSNLFSSKVFMRLEELITISAYMKKAVEFFFSDDEEKAFNGKTPSEISDYNNNKEEIWHTTNTGHDGGNKFGHGSQYCYTKVLVCSKMLDLELYQVQQWYDEDGWFELINIRNIGSLEDARLTILDFVFPNENNRPTKPSFELVSYDINDFLSKTDKDRFYFGRYRGTTSEGENITIERYIRNENFTFTKFQLLI